MKNLIEDLDIISKPSTTTQSQGGRGKLYIESYGCQMNFSDSEIIASILTKEGFTITDKAEDADLVFLNTCSIRDKAEQTIRHRLDQIQPLKKKNPALLVGILGCMAERLKSQLLEEEKIVDLVAGPDAYRTLPDLIAQAEGGSKAINTFLSREETYFDVDPVRLDSNGVSAFISIMRGCDNMCSFCVVPFTRGRERSRDPQSIVAEAQRLVEAGYREVTLLGQNVDSYKWSEADNNKARLEKNNPDAPVVRFSDLLRQVASVSPLLRVRFSTSHPKDITDDVLHAMAEFENICKYIHLPAQSGNSRILELMNRGYTREWYLEKVSRIREVLGSSCGLSTDIITGFCSETEAEHQDTITLMEKVGFDYAYMFAYSERPGTPAEKKLKDDVPADTKKRRLEEVIAQQSAGALDRNRKEIGKIFRVLVEGRSRRSAEHLQGRNSANKVIVFPAQGAKAGDYVDVRVHDCTAATLLGTIIEPS